MMFSLPSGLKSYAIVPSEEDYPLSFHEGNVLHARNRYYTKLSALVIGALATVLLSGMIGLQVGIRMKVGKDTEPAWTQSLSRGTYANIQIGNLNAVYVRKHWQAINSVS